MTKVQALENIQLSLEDYRNSILLAGLTVYSEEFNELTAACTSGAAEFLAPGQDFIEYYLDRFYDLLELVTSANELAVAKRKYMTIIETIEAYNTIVLSEGAQDGVGDDTLAGQESTVDSETDTETATETVPGVDSETVPEVITETVPAVDSETDPEVTTEKVEETFATLAKKNKRKAK